MILRNDLTSVLIGVNHTDNEGGSVMADLPFPVLDADNHFYETQESFTRHLPKKYHSQLQYVEVAGKTRLAIGNLISDYVPNPTFSHVAAPGVWDTWNRAENTEGLSLRELTGKSIEPPMSYRTGAERLKVLDDQGIQSTLMFPTLASAIEERMGYDHDLLHAAIHSLNEWIYDEWTFDREGRIYSVPCVTLANVDQALGELEWIIKNGAKAIGIRPAPVPGYRGSRSFGLKCYDPFWARVAEARLLVCMHSSDSGYDRFTRMWEGGSELLPFEDNTFRDMQRIYYRAIEDSVAALICHGVFDRHPQLRVACIENGSNWVAPMLKQFKHVYGQSPQAFKQDPVETFRKHIFVAPYYEEDIAALAQDIGVNRVLFGSDFPHPEGLKNPLDYVAEIETMNISDQAAIMGGNLQGLLEGVRL
jgi:predicted TIM-barrel fold metal-dependent hydrolase